MTVLEQLIQQLARLPGIGRKSAGRIAYFLLSADTAYVAGLAHSVSTLQSRIHKCRVCGNYTETELCAICRDANRETDRLCVVENPQDIRLIESSKAFRGRYHVLHGLISPMEGIGPGDIAVGSLLRRIEAEPITEVILATNPTVEGDTTALYIRQQLEDSTVTVTRLALGLPVGGDLEYADQLTIARALQDRQRLSSG